MKSAKEQKPFRILVVEDEEHLGRLYAEELGDEGYAVDVAGTVTEAATCIDAGGVDAVVLDLKLGIEDGADVLRHIMEQNRDLPVIINTGCGELRSDFRLWGADNFVVKSSDMGELKRRLADLRQQRSHK